MRLDIKWGKTCESFLNLVDNKLKDHQGIAPDPTQFPESWYITRLNHTLEPHTTLYQFIINHQIQADAIACHTSTPSAAATTYESHLYMCEPSAKQSITPIARLSRRRQGVRLYRLNLNELMDMDRAAGEKDMAVAMVLGRVETLGVVGNLKGKEAALVGSTITGFLVNSLINWILSHMHGSFVIQFPPKMDENWLSYGGECDKK